MGRGSLPASSAPLFGRRDEVTELRELVGGERLLTLVGAPGSGKTRLAVEVGEQIAPAFAGGVRFVDLTPVGEPASVPAAVAAALGVPEEWGRPMRDVLIEAMGRAEPVLVLLDNCEHLTAGVAALAGDLVDACPPVSVLATGRTALGLPGERVWHVPPLDSSAAVDLFTDRARSLPGAGAALDASDGPCIERICAWLGCLPLAVELTAAWSRVLSPSQILDRLTGGARELAAPGRGGDRVPGPRHDTMAAAVEWSYQLLSPDAQQVFRRMSVFAGGCELWALTAVAGSSAEPVDVPGAVAELVNNSLVLTEPTGGGLRYRMLEPVRQHARAVLDRSGEGDVTRRQHYEHHVRLATRYDPWRWGATARPVRLERLAADEGNLLAALDWARRRPPDLELRMITAASLYFTHGGRVNDALRWLEEALAKGTQDLRLRTKAAREAGQLAWMHGDYDRAHAWLDEARTLAEALGDPLQVAWAYRLLSVVELSAGDTEASAAHAQQALDACEACGDQLGVASALTSRAWTRYVLGDADAGDEDMRAALRANRPVGNPTVTAFGHFGLTYGATLRRDTAAQRIHLAAVRVAIDEGGVVERSDWLGLAAALATHEGRYHSAVRLLGGRRAWEQRRGGTMSPAQLAAPIHPLFDRVFQEVAGALVGQLWAQGEDMGWDELVAETLEPHPGHAGHPGRAQLTPRESEIAHLVAEGLANGDIAQRLVLSRRTVESHVANIRRKLGLQSRNEIIVWALDGRRRPSA